MKHQFSFLAQVGDGSMYHKTNPNKIWYNIEDYFNADLQTRSPIYDIDQLKNKKIILVAGDSFTFGDGIYYVDTYSNYLKTLFYNDEKYEVVNIGLPGLSNDRIVQVIQNWVNTFGEQIETIIVGTTFTSRRVYYFDNEHSKNCKNSLYYSDNKINPDWINFNMSLLNRKEDFTTKKIKSAFLELNSRYNDYRDYEKNLLMINYISIVYDIKVFWWGWLSIFPDDDKNFIIKKFTTDRMKYIPVCDINHKLHKISDSDGHWNSKGHADVAKYIINCIKYDKS